MKKQINLLSAIFILFFTINVNAQEKKAPLSPPATVTQTLKNGTVVTINYAQPSVKGRTLGKEIAAFGQVWRTGANAATQFEISKAATINGKSLAAGKYALFTIPGEKEWTIIFNKTVEQWGSYKYDDKEDALRVVVKAEKAKSFTEQMTFTIDKSGKVSLVWANTLVPFIVK